MFLFIVATRKYRDINAAKNILQKALCTVGHTGTYAWGDTAWLVLTSQVMVNR
ncbi:hypothetical protein [Dapis sp. BLCC M229]|uniref:hypothetical protein n=1 Tax=Dapis sp. BLCC M229 TaxID=3400188 RepID=UPI003CEB8222